MQPLIVVHTESTDTSVHSLIEALYSQSHRDHDVLIVGTCPPSDLSRVTDRYPVAYLELPAGTPVAGMLNEACARHEHEFIVTLAAGVMPRDSEWLFRLLRHFERPRVVAVTGADYDPGRVSVRNPGYLQDLLDFLAAPHFGFSFDNGAFRRERWKEHCFPASNATCADKQWAYHWLRQGERIAMDYTARVHPGRERSEEERFRRYWFMSLAFGEFIQPQEDLRTMLREAARETLRSGSLEPVARIFRQWSTIKEQHYWRPDAIHALLARQHFARRGDEWAV